MEDALIRVIEQFERVVEPLTEKETLRHRKKGAFEYVPYPLK